MAKETAKKFLLEYAANPEAMRLVSEYPHPETLEDGAGMLAEIAGKLGIAFTAEEMAEAIGEAEAARKARTDAAAGDLTALPDDELGEIAGGMRDTSCWADYYCYGIYHESPEGRTDVPCTLNYNCLLVSEYTKCENNFFASDPIDGTFDHDLSGKRTQERKKQ
ncbi:MAG: hypothetical protein IK082_12325 [Oscillospiraceae bacterium]|nr:hypothetical protein [Oscillospiraceae bacterium]